jgi:hypothetical protein
MTRTFHYSVEATTRVFLIVRCISLMTGLIILKFAAVLSSADAMTVRIIAANARVFY